MDARKDLSPPPEAPVTSNSPGVVSLADVETVDISLPRSREENGIPNATRISVINNNSNRRLSIFPDPNGTVGEEEETPLLTHQVVQTIPQSVVHNDSPRLLSESPPPYPGLQNTLSPPPYPGLQNTYPIMARRTNDVPIIRNNNETYELNRIPTLPSHYATISTKHMTGSLIVLVGCLLICNIPSLLFTLPAVLCAWKSVHLELRGNYNLSMKFQKAVDILSVAVAIQFVGFVGVVIFAGLAVFGVVKISFPDC